MTYARKSKARHASIVVVAFVVLWVIPVTSALAYTFQGCQYDSAQPPSITYKFHSVTTTYQTAFNSAQANWDGDTSPTTYFASTSSSDPNIDVYDGSYSSGNWAWISYSCWWLTDTYVGDEVQMYLNTRTMGSLSSNEKMIVTSHELGHAYGLGHSSFGCSSPGPVVMKTGTSKFACAGTPPWSNDVGGWNQMY